MVQKGKAFLLDAKEVFFAPSREGLQERGAAKDRVPGERDENSLTDKGLPRPHFPRWGRVPRRG